MRSLLGFISPYVRSLELRVDSLECERDMLLDRVLLLTTGQPLEYEPKPEQELTPEQKAAVRKTVDDIADTNSYPTMSELLADLEAKSFHESAEKITGREEIVEGADVVNSYREAEELDAAETLERRKRMQQAAAKAVANYKAGERNV